MVDVSGAIVFATIQTALTTALVVDRWVHRVTGGRSLDTRVADLEKSVADMHKKASDFMSAQQVSVGDVSVRLAQIDEHLRNTDKAVDKLERRRNYRGDN